jgi:hypothetical protein
MTSTNYIPIWAFHTRLYYVPYIEYSKVFFLCIWKCLPASEMLLSIEGTFCHSNAELFVLYIVEALLPEVSPNICVCTLQAMPLKLSLLNQGRPWRAGYHPILYISNPILSNNYFLLSLKWFWFQSLTMSKITLGVATLLTFSM